MCAIGIARDIAALLSQKVKKPEFDLEESKEKASDYIKVTIDAPEACPRYAARMIKNVKVAKSPLVDSEKTDSFRCTTDIKCCRYHKPGSA